MYIYEMTTRRNNPIDKHDLNPGEFSFDDWESEYHRSPVAKAGDRVVGVNAVVSSMGGSAIVLIIRRFTVESGGKGIRLVYSPYFNQSASECSDECIELQGSDPEYDCEGMCSSEYNEIERDATEWLTVMAGATNWHEWDWLEIG